VLDGLVVSAPSIREAIPSGNAQITGSFSQVEAQDLANVLKYGALPLAFDRGEVQQVSPTLGADQLNAGLLAGALGLGLVVIFSMLYYRGLGIVTVGSLAIATAILYLLFLVLGKSIGFTLTLAGIAGAIVAIGVGFVRIYLVVIRLAIVGISIGSLAVVVVVVVERTLRPNR